jgi:hypothetical protein
MGNIQVLAVAAAGLLSGLAAALLSPPDPAGFVSFRAAFL